VPGSKEQIRARAASHLEDTLPAIPIELDEAEQVMQLFEVIVIEIRKEAR
jgi:hypothetical protein